MRQGANDPCRQLGATPGQDVWNSRVFELYEARCQRRPDIAEVQTQSAKSEVYGVRCLDSKQFSDTASNLVPASGRELSQLSRPTRSRGDHSNEIAPAIVLGRCGQDQRVAHADQRMRRLVGARRPELDVLLARIRGVVENEARHDGDGIQELMATRILAGGQRRYRGEGEAAIELLKMESGVTRMLLRAGDDVIYSGVEGSDRDHDVRWRPGRQPMRRDHHAGDGPVIPRRLKHLGNGAVSVNGRRRANGRGSAQRRSATLLNA